MNIVHLTSSTFFGGPERQMLGLAKAMPEEHSIFLTFREKDRCREFLAACKREGQQGYANAARRVHLPPARFTS